GATEAEVERMAGLGVLVARDGAGPFRVADVAKVRLAGGGGEAGLPMEGIAAATRAGRLSFAFLEAAPFRRWAVRSARTYRAVCQQTGVPLDLLRGTLESMGFAPAAAEEPMREDALEMVPLVRLGDAPGAVERGSVGPR